MASRRKTRKHPPSSGEGGNHSDEGSEGEQGPRSRSSHERASRESSRSSHERTSNEKTDQSERRENEERREERHGDRREDRHGDRRDQDRRDQDRRDQDGNDNTENERTQAERTGRAPKSPVGSSSFGQVVPMCSDDEWLAAEAAKPSSQLNLAKTKGKVTVFATPSSQKQIRRKALNQSHAAILGKLVTNLVGQLLESKEGTEIEVHVKIGGHSHNLIKKTFPDAPLPKSGTTTPLPTTPMKTSRTTTDK